LSDMRYDVGPGLRYQTPIGPIRVDLGYQLNPIPGLLVNGKADARRFRFHFSIGQAF
jgi:outer membrane translocation and assembly module TamA